MAEISNPVKLNFDPKSLKDRYTSKAFESKLGKILWIAMYDKEKIEEDFSKNCFDLGKHLEANEVPANVSRLHALIVMYFSTSFAEKYSRNFKEELRLYLKHEDLEYIVV